MTLSPADEAVLLDAAKRGDEWAFGRLVTARRQELHAHCYRMLASVDDADDAVQEALVRAWRALPSFEGRSSLRTWLVKIATNTALDLATKRTRRELPVSFGPEAGPTERPGGPRTEVAWMTPYPGSRDAEAALPEASYAARERLELAYVAALQRLPAHQRAVFILREALDFSAAETATILEKSLSAVNSALQRARAELRDRLPEVSQQTELDRIGDTAARKLAARYARAIEQADLDTLLSLLTEDASWSMPPLASWYRGPENIRAFLAADVFPERWRHETTWANGQLAVAGYLFYPERNGFEPAALDVLELRNGRIASVTGFLVIHSTKSGDTGPPPVGLFTRFGLPELLPPKGAGDSRE